MTLVFFSEHGAVTAGGFFAGIAVVKESLSFVFGAGLGSGLRVRVFLRRLESVNGCSDFLDEAAIHELGNCQFGATVRTLLLRLSEPFLIRVMWMNNTLMH
jgi:hypothetical protein